MTNEKIKADLRGALSPFWNLVQLILIDDEDLPDDKEKYARMLQDEAERCESLKPRLVELINGITNAETKPPKKLKFNILNFSLSYFRYWNWGKSYVTGSVIGKNSQGEEVQEHIGTNYYWGYLRVSIRHKWRFVKF